MVFLAAVFKIWILNMVSKGLELKKIKNNNNKYWGNGVLQLRIRVRVERVCTQERHARCAVS